MAQPKYHRHQFTLDSMIKFFDEGRMCEPSGYKKNYIYLTMTYDIPIDEIRKILKDKYDEMWGEK